jgi:hypothetical protein
MIKPIASGSPLAGIKLGVRNNSIEPTVNIRKPKLNKRTLPKISESLPTVTRRTAVTTIYPIRIQSKYSNESNGSRLIPLNIAGSEINMIVPLIEAIKTPIVVFDNATHLY